MKHFVHPRSPPEQPDILKVSVSGVRVEHEVKLLDFYDVVGKARTFAARVGGPSSSSCFRKLRAFVAPRLIGLARSNVL
jgi:hypothetical protein